MKKLAVIVLLCLACLISGCATPAGNQGGPDGMQIIEGKVNQVAIGMTQAEVKGLLGPPSHGKNIIVAGGTEDIWGYNLDTLSENILTSDSQKFALGFRSGAAGINLRAVLLKITFTNGAVTRIEK